jgi:hypothetical protein
MWEAAPPHAPRSFQGGGSTRASAISSAIGNHTLLTSTTAKERWGAGRRCLPASFKSEPQDDAPLIELSGIGKDVRGCHGALERRFHLAAGEVHGLVGENGAGKSDVMKIIAGVHTEYEGTYRLDGQVIRLAPPGTRSRPASAWCTRNCRSCPISRSPRTSSSAASRPPASAPSAGGTWRRGGRASGEARDRGRSHGSGGQLSLGLSS